MFVDRQMIDVRLHRVHGAELCFCENVVTGQVVIHYYPVGDNPFPKPPGFAERHDSMAKAEAHVAEMFPASAGYRLDTVIGKGV